MTRNERMALGLAALLLLCTAEARENPINPAPFAAPVPTHAAGEKDPVTAAEWHAWNVANIARAPELLDLVVAALRIASDESLTREEKDHRMMAVFGVYEKQKPYKYQGSGYFSALGDLDGTPPDIVSDIHWVRPGHLKINPGKACVRQLDVLPRFHHEFGLPPQIIESRESSSTKFNTSSDPRRWWKEYWVDGPVGYGISAAIIWRQVGVTFRFLLASPNCAWQIQMDY